MDDNSKIAVVTGTSRGVGQVIAQYLLDTGFIVFGMSRSSSSIQHDQFIEITTDFRDIASVQNAFAVVRSHTKIIDVLVNNAATLTSQYLMIMPADAAKSMIETNLLAPILVTKEALRFLRKSKNGRIINISSMAPRIKAPGDAVYAATKAGLEIFSEITAREVSAYGVTSNTIAISAFDSDMFRSLNQEVVGQVIESLVQPRLLSNHDITNVLDFLISDKSSGITAQTIHFGGVS
jgi:3-oxoacyl-[acyl-carrier protein] reductase